MTVIVNVDNQYSDELAYSYQITLAEDNTYSVYVGRGPLRGRIVEQKIQSLEDAMTLLIHVMNDEEGMNIFVVEGLYD